MLPEYHLDSSLQLALRPTRVEVSSSALAGNVRNLSSMSLQVDPRIMAVVKANGYGHGLLLAARTFVNAGVDSLAVGFLEEGILLRREGIKCPILVLGGLVDYQISTFVEYDLQMTISSVHKADQVQKFMLNSELKAKVQLKIDLEMERIGVHLENAAEFIKYAASLTKLNIRGVYSHLANAASGIAEKVNVPVRKFNQLRDSLNRLLIADCDWHLANSAAICGKSIDDNRLLRPGLALYGANPGPHNDLEFRKTFRPALSWKSAVVYFKVVKAGRGISYGHNYQPVCDTRIVTVPVGYGDGYARSMSGKAEVLIRAKRYPVVGTICMDQIMVDIGPQGTAFNGDEVVLVGRQGNEQIYIEDLASWQSTIPYESLCAIADRVPRILVD
jgi:alanine racemase